MAKFPCPNESILKSALLKWQGVYFKSTQYIFISFIKMFLLNEARIYLTVVKIKCIFTKFFAYTNAEKSYVNVDILLQGLEVYSATYIIKCLAIPRRISDLAVL